MVAALVVSEFVAEVVAESEVRVVVAFVIVPGSGVVDAAPDELGVVAAADGVIDAAVKGSDVTSVEAAPVATVALCGDVEAPPGALDEAASPGALDEDTTAAVEALVVLMGFAAVEPLSVVLAVSAVVAPAAVVAAAALVTAGLAVVVTKRHSEFPSPEAYSPTPQAVHSLASEVDEF